MIIRKLLTPKGKMGLPPGVANLVAELQAALSPLAFPNPIPSFNEFMSYNTEKGILDRQYNPELYTENASKLLDFHLFNTPQLMHEFFNAYEDSSSVFTLANAGRKLNSQMDTVVDPALLYIDPQHFIPSLLDPRSAVSDDLYHKMLIFKWFLSKLSDYGLAQRRIALDDYSKAELSHGTLALLQNYIHDDLHFGDEGRESWEQIPWAMRQAINLMNSPRQRLATLNQRTEAYAAQHSLQQLTLAEIEERFVKPQLSRLASPQETLKNGLKNESPIIILSNEANHLDALLKNLQKQHQGLDSQLKMLCNREKQIKDSLLDLKEKERDIFNQLKHPGLNVEISLAKIKDLESQLGWHPFAAQNVVLKARIYKLKAFVNKKISKLKEAQLKIKKQKQELHSELKGLAKTVPAVKAKQKILMDEREPVELILKDKEKVHLQKYKDLYEAQVKARFIRTCVAVTLSILSCGLLAIPAYLIWRAYRDAEPLQRLELAPTHYNVIKALRKEVYLQSKSPEALPKKAVEQSDPDPSRPAVYYMDRSQVQRFRFFESLAAKNDHRPLSLEQCQTLNASKRESLKLFLGH